MIISSGRLGLTLPGKKDEPFCTGAMVISAQPALGPEDMIRISRAILEIAAARDFRHPDTRRK